jgi:hypothetical protein
METIQSAIQAGGKYRHQGPKRCIPKRLNMSRTDLTGVPSIYLITPIDPLCTMPMTRGSLLGYATMTYKITDWWGHRANCLWRDDRLPGRAGCRGKFRVRFGLDPTVAPRRCQVYSRFNQSYAEKTMTQLNFNKKISEPSRFYRTLGKRKAHPP